MNGLVCDRCGKTLLLDEDVRYIVQIEVYAAYDPMEITADDLRRDHRAELRTLVRSMERADPGALQDAVHRGFTFDLCPACQREYLRDPLPRKEA